MQDQPVETIRRSPRPLLPGGGLTDTRLLERFLDDRDQAAFELLVWRHGPMVLRVCRRVLRDWHGAEDAFQATFLTFAYKAADIGKRESVGSWLYKVAYRIALRARDGSSKRATRERPLADSLVAEDVREPSEEAAWRELGPLLDAEVQRLPEKYRAAFILCCLDGKTNEEAAEELGCPKGTLLSRLARARERLRTRLERRGLALSGAVFPLLAHPNGWAHVKDSSALVDSTVCMALKFVQEPQAAAALSSSVARLLEGTRHAKRIGWHKWAAAVLIGLILSVGGAAAYGAWRSPIGDPVDGLFNLMSGPSEKTAGESTTVSGCH
jgi:RNA polymerase sigma factor (sigma-70 family)